MQKYLLLSILILVTISLKLQSQHSHLITLNLTTTDPAKPDNKSQPVNSTKPTDLNPNKPDDKSKPNNTTKPADSKKPSDKPQPQNKDTIDNKTKPNDKLKPVDPKKPENKDQNVTNPDPGVKSDKVTDYPMNCNSKGRCWQWCGANDKLAATKNDFHKQTDGKWCYTTVQNSCKTRDDCKGKTTCVDSCEARWG